MSALHDVPPAPERLAELERAVQDVADASRRRLELLARAAELLDAPPDLEETLRQVADLAVEELADWCAVDLEAEDGAPRIVATTHRDPAMVSLARQMQARWPAPADDPVRRQMLTDLAPVHIPEVTDDMLVAAAQDLDHLESLRSLGMTSAVSVPLQAGGRGFGAMLLVSTGEHRLGPRDVDLALELGRRAGAAVEKAQLMARQQVQALELRRSEARYRTLVETGSVGFFRADTEGSVLTEIPAWNLITGGRPVVGWAWLDSVHPEDRDGARDLWCTALRTGDPYDATYRLTTPDGSPRWIHARAVPLREDPDDPGSPAVEWVGTIDDVTEVVLARRRTEAVRDSAEALARALGVDQVIHALHHVAANALDAHASAVGLRMSGSIVVDQFGYTGIPPMTVDDGSPDDAWPLIRKVISTGRPLFVRSPDELTSLAVGSAGLAGQVATAIAEGEVCWAVLPLRYGADLLGAVRFGFTEPHDFDRPHRDTLHAIAAQHAAALVRARLYDAEREISLTLQAALAPRVPSTVNGVEIAMHYRPAGSQAQVGGDWVDALALPGGRVCLVVGDVMGSGIPAATTMGRLRTALTALALHEDDPAALLRDLDTMLMPDDLLATVGLVVVDATSGVVDLYSAGHLPALVAQPDGRAELVSAHQVPPVGVGWSKQGPPPDPVRVQVGPGVVVALCTDGLVETRQTAIDERLEHWRRTVEERLPIGALDTGARDLVDAMHVEADDDVTLLLARLPEAPAAQG